MAGRGVLTEKKREATYRELFFLKALAWPHTTMLVLRSVEMSKRNEKDIQALRSLKHF